MAIPKRVFSCFCALLAFAALVKNFDGSAHAATEDKGTTTNNATTPKGAPNSGKVFGRLDEIGQSPLPKIGLNADTKKFSGTVISAYPEELLGDWGGQLKIFSYKVSDSYRSLDPATCSKSVNLLRPGRMGRSNFCFHKDSSGKVILDPVRVNVMVPAGETSEFEKLARENSLPADRMAELAKQTVEGIGIAFENVRSNSNEKGIAGNQFENSVVKASTRQLGPDVFEKQIFTRSTNILPSKAVLKEVGENVIWFKLIPSEKNLYVRICSLEFSEKGALLSKLVMSGTLVKGRRVETDPRGGSRTSEHEQKIQMERMQSEIKRLQEELGRQQSQ